MRHLLSMSIAFCLSTVGGLSVQAQDQPSLKIVVGFPPGGSADVMARLVADGLRLNFSSIVVENKAGAGGRIALAFVKAAKPDGQTVIVLPSGPMVLFPHEYRKLEYDPVKDFTPISQLALFQFGVVSGPATHVSSMAEMIALCKSHPESASFGSPGLGTLPQFIGEMLGQTAGVVLNHVPFQGGAPANNALLGGHIGYKFDVVSETAELHRNRKVRIIAVTGSKRDSQVPEVPTLKEQGINMEATAWFAMYGPAHLNANVLAYLETAVMQAMHTSSMRERMDKLGYEATGTGSSELAAIQKADFLRWEKPIKSTGLQLE